MVGWDLDGSQEKAEQECGGLWLQVNARPGTGSAGTGAGGGVELELVVVGLEVSQANRPSEITQETIVGAERWLMIEIGMKSTSK